MKDVKTFPPSSGLLEEWKVTGIGSLLLIGLEGHITEQEKLRNVTTQLCKNKSYK